MKDAGARDWVSGLGLSFTHQGRLHFIQWHHIFPKSVLKLAKFETGEINEIANMAFITGRTNRSISNKLPREYLPKIIETQGKAALDTQLVPSDLDVLTVERYREFLQTRREALAECMNGFIQKKAGLVQGDEDNGNSGVSVEELISGGESDKREFKSTLRVNLHTGQSDPRMEMSVLKSIAAFLNSSGGTLFIGVADDGSAKGVGDDKFKSEDGMHLHLVNLVKDRMGPHHMMFMDLRFADFGGKRVMVIGCRPGKTPAYVKDGASEQFFVRTGAATAALMPSQTQTYIKQRFP